MPHLSAGLYVLEAGARDPQSPHTEDELYYFIEGRARVTVGDVERPVVPGSLVFVAAHVAHRFHDIEERLVLLVAFGPAEGSRAIAPDATGQAVSIRASTAAASASASSGPRPVSSWRKKTKASSPASRNGTSRAAQAAISPAS